MWLVRNEVSPGLKTQIILIKFIFQIFSLKHWYYILYFYSNGMYAEIVLKLSTHRRNRVCQVFLGFQYPPESLGIFRNHKAWHHKWGIHPLTPNFAAVDIEIRKFNYMHFDCILHLFKIRINCCMCFGLCVYVK